MKVNNDWPMILSNLMTGAVSDPHAVCNLALAQWSSIRRMMLGSVIPNDDNIQGKTTTLTTQISAGQTRSA